VTLTETLCQRTETGVKIHCLYRDFFLFLRMINLEGDRWSAFKRYYFGKHRGFLSHVWYEYQSFTPANIRERVGSLRKEDYAHIENELKIFDIEEQAREVVQHCKDLLHEPDPCDVYIFIGFFSPDGFVTRYRGRHVICIGLERFYSFRDFDILLSHEYCHYILNKRGEADDGNTLKRTIREGIAVYFSRSAYPGRGDERYLFLSRERVDRLRDMYDELLKDIRKGVLNGAQLFGPESGDLPPRAGYYIGYRLVDDFVRKTGVHDMQFLIKEENQILMDF
jgi:hypothetical protein